jgi:hypothetical protein
MERTELIVLVGVILHRAGRLSRHRPEGESRGLSNERMLWKENTLMRFAQFRTINSVLCNAAELRL